MIHIIDQRNRASGRSTQPGPLAPLLGFALSLGLAGVVAAQDSDAQAADTQGQRAAEVEGTLSRELIRQSQRQQRVGHRMRSTTDELAELYEDLQSNGLLRADEELGVETLRQTLGTLHQENVPAASEALRQAATEAADRSKHLDEADEQIETILSQLSTVLTQAGQDQRGAAYRSLLSRLIAQHGRVLEQTKLWGRTRLMDPQQARPMREELAEQHGQLLSNLDSLRQRIDRDVAQEDDGKLARRLRGVRRALWPETMPAGQPPPTISERVEASRSALGKSRAGQSIQAQRRAMAMLGQALARLRGEGLDEQAGQEELMKGSESRTEVTTEVEPGEARQEDIDLSGFTPSVADDEEELTDLGGDGIGDDVGPPEFETAKGEPPSEEQIDHLFDEVEAPKSVKDAPESEDAKAEDVEAPDEVIGKAIGPRPPDILPPPEVAEAAEGQSLPAPPMPDAGSPKINLEETDASGAGGGFSPGGNYDPDVVPPKVLPPPPASASAGSNVDMPSIQFDAVGMEATHAGDGSDISTAGGVQAGGNYEAGQQEIRSFADEARDAIQQSHERRLPSDYRDLASEYFELLASEP